MEIYISFSLDQFSNGLNWIAPAETSITVSRTNFYKSNIYIQFNRTNKCNNIESTNLDASGSFYFICVFSLLDLFSVLVIPRSSA